MKALLFEVLKDMQNDGMPESVFHLVYNVIWSNFGNQQATVFSNYTYSTDGKFYLKHNAYITDVLSAITKST